MQETRNTTSWRNSVMSLWQFWMISKNHTLSFPWTLRSFCHLLSSSYTISKCWNCIACHLLANRWSVRCHLRASLILMWSARWRRWMESDNWIYQSKSILIFLIRKCYYLFFYYYIFPASNFYWEPFYWAELSCRYLCHVTTVRLPTKSLYWTKRYQL